MFKFKIRNTRFLKKVQNNNKDTFPKARQLVISSGLYIFLRYIYIYICTYVGIYVYEYMYTYMHTRIYIYTCTIQFLKFYISFLLFNLVALQ